MTAQIAEVLRYKGRKVAMCTEPLEDYFRLQGINPGFESNCTALWRGYVGSWEIKDNRLYLTGLQATLMDGTKADLSTLFPDAQGRVFAEWFSGTIRIPEGKQLEYVHMGYGSVFERDRLLELENGVVTATSVVANGVAEDEEAPDKYGVAAMVTFPSAAKAGKERQ